MIGKELTGRRCWALNTNNKLSNYRHCLFLLSVRMTPLQTKSYNFYKKNCMSIELVKEDFLQKVNFRVKNKVGSFPKSMDLLEKR